jgi:hypothetical protein
MPQALGQLLLLAAKAIAIARGPIVVDGVLDDPTWQSAQWITDFEQKQPVFGAPPTHPIKVAVATDGESLYVAARMTGAEVDDALTQRDDTSQAERFIVSIDPSHTRRLAYSFAVTARGVRADWIHTDDSENKRDMSWNPVWTAQARIDSEGWSVEMAIPLSQLRLPREPAASWGIDFDWYIPRKQEDVFWRAVPPDRTAWASYFGELTDLPPIHPGLGLELLPFVASRFVAYEDPVAPPAHRWLAGFEAGLDAKLHPLPGFTIAATVNPDFGQVDQDPAFVNLTAYEVQLPERRPFFIENNSLFANAPSQYFYSRRIGGLPRGGVLPTADAIDLPQQVRILGAAAAGGYVASQTQVALLGAVTDETSANAVVSGVPKELVISPLTGWAAGRIEQQINTSVLGATATFADRALGGTGLGSLLPNTAFALGTDDKLRTCDQTYELLGYGGITGITGTAAAITSIEEDSAHFFQRPDQPHVHLDTDAHDMVGWHAGAIGTKRAGMWQGDAGLNLESPKFELNDVGALQSADDIDTSLDIKRLVTTPGARLFSWDLGLGAYSSWNFGGVHKPTHVHILGDATTAGFYSGSAGVHWTSPGDSDDLTRGGPRMHVGSIGQLTMSASTPYGRAQQLQGNLEVDVSDELQQGVITSATLSSRVVPALRIDITPSLILVETHRQYVATVTDAGGGDETYGARYLFGHLHRTEAAVQLRATWSLSPDLVFTLFAQPFWSRGRYDQIGELTAAGSEDVRWYGSLAHAGTSRAIYDAVTGTGFAITEPDYDVKSLRSTAVMRWEFRPGSILYVVWQQSRTQTSAVHTLAVKLSYWFG